MVMIFLFHNNQLYPAGGQLGVAFFFLLSGFVMTHGYYDKIQSKDFIYRSFIVKRYCKLLPLHWITLVAASFIVIASVFAHEFKLELIPEFLANLFLLQSWIPYPEYYLSFNSVSWYLADTVFFIAIFPFLARYVNNTKHSIQYFLMVFALIAYASLLLFLPHHLYAPVIYIHPLVRLLDFIIGMYLALWVKKANGFISTTSHHNKKIGVLFEVVSFALIALSVIVSITLQGEYRMYSCCYWPFICLLIVTSLLSASYGGGYLLKSKPLIWLGEMSFTFYMVHQLVIRYANIIYSFVVPIEQFWMQVIVNFILSLMVAMALDKLFVKPIINRVITR